MQDAKEIEDHEKKIECEKNNIKQKEHEEEQTNSITPKNTEVEDVNSDEESSEATNDDKCEECV